MTKKFTDSFGDDSEELRDRIVGDLQRLCETKLFAFGYDPKSYRLAVSVTPIRDETDSGPNPTPAEDCPSDGA